MLATGVLEDFQREMDEPPFTVSLLVNSTRWATALVDSGCECFCAVSESFAQDVGGRSITIPPRRLGQAVGTSRDTVISRLLSFQYDLDGWSSHAVAYVVDGLARDVILGKPWMRQEGVVLDVERGVLTVRRAGGMVVRDASRHSSPTIVSMLSAEDFGATIRRANATGANTDRFYATSIRELTSILAIPTGGALDEPKERSIPPELAQFSDLFDEHKASGLPPHRGRMDHHIRLQQDGSGHEAALPWGPLYNMPREQLLELRRQVTTLMDKGWIRASSSPAGAPVLLVKKASGGWRMCVDYRALNKITVADRYPLPLIKETLRTLSGACWFTKVDVRSAFHRIRVAEGDEHLTAFRTRFGLYEWLVCPFGLAGAPATFQRYINSALRETLGDYATAYLDDVLIYSGGSRADHFTKTARVLSLLREAGLHLDPHKCVFAVKEVQYLGYVVRAGEEVRPDPEKIRAIREWEPPRSLRGVRSFLGFANFYRDFIKDFSNMAAPLNRLTGKDVPFRWGPEEDASFHKLKMAFMTEPVLAQWDPERETILEADCSGSALGGCLSQVVDGVLRPVAYHSASLSPEQRNYTIHDKELTAVMQCVGVWSAELGSVAKPFTILTDHKNLEYFTTARRLSERQHRWAEELSRFRFHLKFRPGRLAPRPDALSRREQDVSGVQPPALQVMKPITITAHRTLAPDSGPHIPQLFADEHMQSLWEEGTRQDAGHAVRVQAVKSNARCFPPEANTTQQIGDCALSAHGTLLWRGVTWVPSWEPLTTTIIQRAHESNLAGHPGANTTFHIVRRDYYWTGMSQDVKQFVRNCHCFGAHVSRRKRQGLLQPLPIADRFWSQISMDFMVDLPQADTASPRYLLVITDRLSKYVQLEAMTSMAAEHCATTFRDVWWRFRGFPSAIITDRGSDWLGRFWTTLCKLVGVEQLLSTAHHPQTDGGTERANQEVQAVLRVMVNFEQTDWPQCLPACQLALNNRDSSVTGVSPNLLLNGYNVDLLQTITLPNESQHTPQGRAVHFLDHLRQGAELTQAAIAFVQQRQQESTNRARRPAERFQVGDRVWFSLRNVKTDRPSRKLDWLQAQYTVTATPTPLTVTLDLPGNLHKTVHVDLVERAASDALPSQKQLDNRPGPVSVLQDEDADLAEWEVEEILKVKNARGRGKKQVLVQWKGWLRPTWEPLEELQDTEAWARFESRHHKGNGKSR